MRSGAGEDSAASLGPGLARSGLWAASGQIGLLAATFVATPFTIRLLGVESYGLWSLLASALLYFTLADLGMATASTRFASVRYADGDSRGEAAVIWTALALTTVLTSLVAIAAAIAAPFIVSDLLKIGEDLQSSGTLAFRFVCVAAVGYAVTGIANTPQQVRLQWGSVTLATSGPRILQVGLAPVVLVATSGGVAVMAFLALLAALSGALANFLVGVRLQPSLRRPRLTREALAQIVRYGGWLGLAALAALPLKSAERFLLSYFDSPTEVAHYAVAAALATLLTVIPATMSSPMLAPLTRLASQGRADEHRRLYRQTLRGVLLLSTPAALLLTFIADPFLSLWGGPAYAPESVTAFYVLIGGIWFNALANPPLHQLLAAGRTSTIAVVHLAELVPYLALAALLTARYGVVGAAVAWTARVVVDSVAFTAITRRSQGLPWLPTPTHGLAWLVGVLLLAGTLLGLSTIASSLGARVAWSLVAATVYGLAEWKLVLTAQERRGLLGLGRGIFARRPRGGEGDGARA